jgi:hypothetical protein
MISERSSDVKFEIGHVLFLDIVGYSKLLITEQTERLQTLKEILRGTEQFRLAEALHQEPSDNANRRLHIISERYGWLNSSYLVWWISFVSDTLTD